MNKKKLTASLTLIGALTLSATSASAFTSHVSVHSSPHISSRSSFRSSPRSSFKSSPKISSKSSAKSWKSSSKAPSKAPKKSASKSHDVPSSHAESSIEKVTIGGRSVTKDKSKHTIKNSSSKTTYNEKFYNNYQPYRTSSSSFWSWMWWSNIFSSHKNVNMIEGTVLSKDGNNKITIKSKDLGNVQVKVSKAKYNSVVVGQHIKLK